MGNQFSLLFTGGGARSAYQVGVLSGLKSICDDLKRPFPFKIVTGYSGGAINAAYLASRFHELDDAIPMLEKMWNDVSSEQIYRSDFPSVAGNLFYWLRQLVIGKFLSNKSSRLSLLDATPLMTLLMDRVDFKHISANINSGILNGIAISAFNYSTGNNEIFYESATAIKSWHGNRRFSVNMPIGLRHVMASASIPVIFPAVKIKTDFYGDGSLRNYSPLSPPLHLGSDKVFVIGVTKQGKNRAVHEYHSPSLVRILGMVLNAALLDATQVDFDVSQRINDLIDLIPKTKAPFKKIDVFLMTPSQDLGDIAMKHAQQLPGMIKYFLQEMGSKKEGADILSYLLFTPAFNKEIIKLGKKDIEKRRDEVVDFLSTSV